VRAGAKIIGAKVGYTSRATQPQFGVSAPVFGLLVDSGLHRDGGEVPYDRMISPKIEPEVAGVLKDDLKGPGVTVANALSPMAGVMPVFELVDSRMKDWRASAIDMTADSVGGWGIVLGGRLTPIAGLDLRTIGVVLERNGEVVSTGRGAAALGNPADVLAWLANRLAMFNLGLTKGQVVITGSRVRAEPITRGDCYRATFDRLGAVSITFP
jgi:2-keto-4-pentenoate hydratase